MTPKSLGAPESGGVHRCQQRKNGDDHQRTGKKRWPMESCSKECCGKGQKRSDDGQVKILMLTGVYHKQIKDAEDQITLELIFEKEGRYPIPEMSRIFYTMDIH